MDSVLADIEIDGSTDGPTRDEGMEDVVATSKPENHKKDKKSKDEKRKDKKEKKRKREEVPDNGNEGGKIKGKKSKRDVL